LNDKINFCILPVSGVPVKSLLLLACQLLQNELFRYYSPELGKHPVADASGISGVIPPMARHITEHHLR
jgi:hypothetical protein